MTGDGGGELGGVVLVVLLLVLVRVVILVSVMECSRVVCVAVSRTLFIQGAVIVVAKGMGDKRTRGIIVTLTTRINDQTLAFTSQ